MPENILFPGTLEAAYTYLQILFGALLALLCSLLLIYFDARKESNSHATRMNSEHFHSAKEKSMTTLHHDRRPAYADEIKELLTFE